MGGSTIEVGLGGGGEAKGPQCGVSGVTALPHLGGVGAGHGVTARHECPAAGGRNEVILKASPNPNLPPRSLRAAEEEPQCREHRD